MSLPRELVRVPKVEAALLRKRGPVRVLRSLALSVIDDAVMLAADPLVGSFLVYSCNAS